MPSPTFQLYTSILHLRSLPLLLRCAAPRGSTQHAAHSFFSCLVSSSCCSQIVGGGWLLLFFSLSERKMRRSQSSAVTRSILFFAKLLASVNNFGCCWDKKKKSPALFPSKRRVRGGDFIQIQLQPHANHLASHLNGQKLTIPRLFFFSVRFYIAVTSVLQRTEKSREV